MDVRGVYISVTGRVQGVGFRYFVYRIAVRYGLRGYVRNLFSGEVEIEAYGDRGTLEIFIHDIRIGPRSAVVHDMKVRWLESATDLETFEIR